MSAPAQEGRGALTLQSLLATTGAGLLAIAAIVFTFFNPDLADPVLRSAIVGLVTLVFLGAALILSRRMLRFSAEAVGGLGLIFVGLDIWAIAQPDSTASGEWLIAAGALFVSACILLLAGMLIGIRVWAYTALIGFAVAAAFLGYAGGSALTAAGGHIAAALVSVGLLALHRRLLQHRTSAPDAGHAGSEPLTSLERLGGRLSFGAARLLLAWVQVVAIASALVLLGAALPGQDRALPVAGLLLVLAAYSVAAARVASWSSRASDTFGAEFLPQRGFGGVWSFLLGASLPLALTVAAVAVQQMLREALDPRFSDGPALFVLAAGLGAAAVLIRVPEGVAARAVASGAIAVIGGSALLPFLLAVAVGARSVVSFVLTARVDVADSDWTWNFVASLALAATGLAGFASMARRLRAGAHRHLRKFASVADTLATFFGALVILVLGCVPLLPEAARIAVVIVGTAVASLAVILARSRGPRTKGSGLPAAPTRERRRIPQRVALPILISAHFAIVVAAMLGWEHDPLPVGVLVLGILTLVAAASAPEIRFFHVAAGYSYALILANSALSQFELSGTARLSLVTALALAGAISSTYLRGIGARAWQAILVVTFAPFAAGVVQLVFERSGWTALTTGLMFVFAFTLLVTRRAGLTGFIRAAAASLLVPSAAVFLVSLGAQVLLTSASPVILPMIALLVALVLPAQRRIRATLGARGLSERLAGRASLAIETSTLVTGAIAVLLSFARVAAGLPTATIVLVLLGLGGGFAAKIARRGYGWWLAALSFSGALWCLLGLGEVTVVEAYLLPPAVVGAAVGALLTARRGWAGAPVLYGVGLAFAILPTLLLLSGSTRAISTGWQAVDLVRGSALLVGSWVLIVLAALLKRAVVLARLRTVTLVMAGAAALSGSTLAVQLGLGVPLAPRIGALHGAGLTVAAFGLSALAAATLLVVARALLPARTDGTLAGSVRDRLMMGLAPLAFAVAVWPSIERDWFSIWAMWLVMLGYLIATVAAAGAPRSHGTPRPPVWLLFSLAFITAIVAWSPRDLRVEAFSLPLGLFLLAAGVRGLSAGSTAPEAGRRTLTGWPGNWAGSWALLAPGLIVTVLASILATFTDPQTWRAILVILLALGMLLVGAGKRLAAPFFIGLVVLPLENVFVFSVQIGRNIASMPWWITLAAVGAVLLAIAVTAERRAGEAESFTARIRDLR